MAVGIVFVILTLWSSTARSISKMRTREEAAHTMITLNVQNCSLIGYETVFRQIVDHLPEYHVERQYYIDRFPLDRNTVMFRSSSYHPRRHIFHIPYHYGLEIYDDSGLIARTVVPALHTTLVKIAVDAIRCSLVMTCPTPWIVVPNWTSTLRADVLHRYCVQRHFFGAGSSVAGIRTEVMEVAERISQVIRNISPEAFVGVVSHQLCWMEVLERLSSLPEGLWSGEMNPFIDSLRLIALVLVGLSNLLGLARALADFALWVVSGFSPMEEGICMSYEEDVSSPKGSVLRVSLAVVEFCLGFTKPKNIAGGVLLYGVISALGIVCRYPCRELMNMCAQRYIWQMLYWFPDVFGFLVQRWFPAQEHWEVLRMGVSGMGLIRVRWMLGPAPFLRGLSYEGMAGIGLLTSRVHVVLWHRMLRRLGMWSPRRDGVMELENGARIWDAEPSVGGLCLICFSDLDESNPVGSVSCGHLYHVECIARALETEPCCPYCGHPAWDGRPPAVASGE
jgi:hypothetical protein